MPIAIQPVIAAKQLVYDYLGITAAQAAGNLLDGSSTWGAWVQALLDRSASLIVAIIGYDKTTAQQKTIRFIGNNQAAFRNLSPIAAIGAFKYFDLLNEAAEAVSIGTGALTVSSTDPNYVFRNDGNVFERTKRYIIDYTQAADTAFLNNWPEALIQIQIEEVALIIQGSNMGNADLGLKDSEEFNNQNVSFANVRSRLEARLRPFRRYAT